MANWFDGAVVVVSRYRPLPGVVLWCGTGLPCFMVSLWMVCPALRPRPCPRTSLRGPRISPPSSQRRRPSGISLFRGSFTRLSISLSTLHAAISGDDARLAYSAALLACWRISTRLGGAAAFPALRQSPGFRLLFCRFVSVIVSFWFLLSGLSPPPCLCTAPCD